jgi:cell wall-associated NlpC family hydrolase
VGIYIGNNQMVHASSSKGRVVIGKVYSFYAARRLL